MFNNPTRRNFLIVFSFFINSLNNSKYTLYVFPSSTKYGYSPVLSSKCPSVFCAKKLFFFFSRNYLQTQLRTLPLGDGPPGWCGLPPIRTIREGRVVRFEF